MDRLEAQAQYRAMERMLGEYGPGHRFTAADVCHVHRTWLEEIYEWAGEYRQVNLSKGDLPLPQRRCRAVPDGEVRTKCSPPTPRARGWTPAGWPRPWRWFIPS